MTKKSSANKINFTSAMAELDEINEWFQSEDIDLDEALKKFARGKLLIQKCRDRLTEVENEFHSVGQ